MFALSFDLGEKLVKISLISDAATSFNVVLLSPPQLQELNVFQTHLMPNC